MARHWTIDDLAGQTGLSRAHLLGIEHGRTAPTLTTIHRLASAFEVQAWELLKAAEQH